jgi:hypothetical protein
MLFNHDSTSKLSSPANSDDFNKHLPTQPMPIVTPVIIANLLFNLNGVMNQ